MCVRVNLLVVFISLFFIFLHGFFPIFKKRSSTLTLFILLFFCFVKLSCACLIVGVVFLCQYVYKRDCIMIIIVMLMLMLF